MAELYQGRGHSGRLALLDGDGGLLRAAVQGGADVLRPHVAVDEAGADVVEGAGEDGEALVRVLAGEAPRLSAADRERVVGGRVTFVGNFYVFPGGRN